jgi:hypothetical protein
MRLTFIKTREYSSSSVLWMRANKKTRVNSDTDFKLNTIRPLENSLAIRNTGLASASAEIRQPADSGSKKNAAAPSLSSGA